MIKAVSRSLVLAFRIIERVDSAASRASIYRHARGAALDTLFGPEEAVEYVSTTTPAASPPTR